jgi:hypothetical protein
MNAITDAEMMATYASLSADRQELLFTCLQMLLEEQDEDERADRLAAHADAGAPHRSGTAAAVAGRASWPAAPAS